ncbi:MAG: plasmid maintenance system killer [Dehalococcoidia bacterium]|nr:plasmid maintenance system killer [Dehalococcoidia bacterium]
MEIEFGSRDLVRCYEDSREATRRWGKEVAERYVERIELIYRAKTVNELFLISSLRLHPLRGGRRGQLSITLRGRWRLIVSVPEGAERVRVDEVSNHYDD